MILPVRIDKTPDGSFVKCAELGEKGYIENSECNLKLSFEQDLVFIS
jgi:hypothetical protein